MQKQKLAIVSFAIGILAGCTGFKTQFLLLSDTKQERWEEMHGPGEYFMFVVSAPEVRDIGGSRLNAVKALVDIYMVSEQICPETYEVLDDTLGGFEGGASKIIVRCNRD